MGLTVDLAGSPQRTAARAGRLRLAVAVLAVVWLSVAGALAAAGGKPRVWFDAPLPGATLALAPYLVVVHAAADAGIAEVRFLVDGLPATVEPVVSSDDLVLVTWLWNPVAPGPHLLTAVAKAMDGAPSDPVSVGVTIDASKEPEPSPSVSPEPSASPGPTPTPGQSTRVTPGPSGGGPTPTPPPCTPGAPALIAPDDFFLIFDPPGPNPPTFEWEVRDLSCPPSGFHVVVSDPDGATITDGVVGAGARDWTPGAPLPFGRTCGDTVYYWAVWARGSGGTDVIASETRRFTICPGT